MRSGNVLFSAVHFFVVLFIIALGVFFIAIPYADHFRFLLSAMLLDNPDVFAKIGWGVLSLGLMLFFGFYLLNRKRYIHLTMQASKLSIEETIVRDYVYDYWKSLFPKNEVVTDIVITGNEQIEIVANLPKVAMENDDALFEKMEKELSAILERRLGYKRDLLLTLVPE